MKRYLKSPGNIVNEGVNMEGPLLKENSSICLHVNIVLAIMSRLFFFSSPDSIC
jgi:hypothetical protein